MGLSGQVCSDGNRAGWRTQQLASLLCSRVITDRKLLCCHRRMDRGLSVFFYFIDVKTTPTVGFAKRSDAGWPLSLKQR